MDCRSRGSASSNRPWAEALALAAVQNEKWCVPELLRIQAAIASAQGRFEEAEPLLRQSIERARDIGARSWQLRAARDLDVLRAERQR